MKYIPDRDLTLIFSIVREGKKCAQFEVFEAFVRGHEATKIVRYSKRKKKEEKFIAYPFSL